MKRDRDQPLPEKRKRVKKEYPDFISWKQIDFRKINSDSKDDNGNPRWIFRKETLKKVKREAPQDSNGRWCPTCGRALTTMREFHSKGKGTLKVEKDYNVDHYPVPWAKRCSELSTKHKWTSKEGATFTISKDATLEEITPVMRKMHEVDVRMQCPECNQSHQFEGLLGMYTQKDKSGTRTSGGSCRDYDSFNYKDSSDEEDDDGKSRRAYRSTYKEEGGKTGGAVWVF